MKKSIVLGATSGIGREIAVQLVEKGYQVGIAGRRIELLDELKAMAPDAFIAKEFDIQDIDTVPVKLENLVTELGGLDLLVISSGYGKVLEEIDFENEKNTILTNVLGYTCVVDWAINLFEKQKNGHLVGISSIAGIRGNRFSPAYGATKAFQINYLEAMRARLTHLKIPVSVTDVRPGFVDTVMAQGDTIFWLASRQKAAKQIIKAIEHKKKVVYVTKRWVVFAFLLKILPRWIHQKI